MLRILFLLLALATLFFNILLTCYLIRNKKGNLADYTYNKEIVSFDLSQYSAGEEAAATEVLETEVMISLADKE